MAPIRARGDITLVVPKHNAQRPNAALSSVLSSVVKSSNKAAQFDSRAGHTRIGSPSKSSGRNRSDSTGDSNNTTSDAIKAAIESASEWNSLLLTHRAERGPQWDVATQQFLVDEKSIHYYDPSPLRPAPLHAPSLDDPDRSGALGASGSAYRSRGRTRNPTGPPGHHSSASPHPQGLPQQHGIGLGGMGTPSLQRHPSHLQHPGQMMGSPMGHGVNNPMMPGMPGGGMPGGGAPGTPGGPGAPFARGAIPMHMTPRTPMGGGPGGPQPGTPMGAPFVTPGSFYGGTPGGGGPGGATGMPPGMSPGMGGGGSMGGMGGDGAMFSPMHERGRMGMPGRQMSMGGMGPGPGQGPGLGTGMQDGIGGAAGFPMYGS